MKPCIYIAGKLNDMSCNYIKNMHKMITTAKKVRDIGAAVYVPCVDFLEGLISGTFSYEDYFNNSQPFLMRCDAIFVCDNWKTSEGTKREIELAKKLNIPVFYDITKIKYFIFLKTRTFKEELNAIY